MSSRARRVNPAAMVTPFHWGGAAPSVPQEPSYDAAVDSRAMRDAHLAALEREAFAKGFAQGELAGGEAAGQRGEMMLHRLMQTLEELTQVRAQMIYQTERQMVRLAMAIARRVVQREVSLDPDLLMAMARVAMERLGETAQVKVRLHPDDYEAAGAARVAQLAGSNVMILADAHLSRGGCRIESDMGILDAGVDAQLQEIARALLGEDEGAGVPRSLEQ
ncbi:MAG TPA: FliH/SctL family protein [Vicinamibacterales bacterium]